VTEWISAGQQSNGICGVVHFSQSASNLLSGDTWLTLCFGKAWLKKNKILAERLSVTLTEVFP
jgi:hypothetical protein